MVILTTILLVNASMVGKGWVVVIITTILLVNASMVGGWRVGGGDSHNNFIS